MKILVKSKIRLDESLEELEEFLTEKSHCTIANSISLSQINDNYIVLQLNVRSRRKKYFPSKNKTKVLNTTIYTVTKFKK